MKVGRGHKKISDEQIKVEYEKHGNIWKVGKTVGLCGQSVHERLVTMGINKGKNVFSTSDREELKKEYFEYRDSGRLDLLAKRLGRTKPFICRKAREMGLTDQARPYYRTPRRKIVTQNSEYHKNHRVVRKLRGSPHFCEVCGDHNKRKWYDWANLTGDYEDPRDYKRMCRTCHRDYDKKRRHNREP